MLRLVVGVLIFVATLALIVIRPYRLNEALAALGGGALMVLFGFVTLPQAAETLAGEWNVYGFFLGLMTISAIADVAGVFDALALFAARLAGGSALRLYIAVLLAGVLITIFLSNDATALILTPVVYALVTRLRLPVLPFMFACTFIADTASFVLPVSNPINILVLSSFPGDLGEFLRYLALPSVAAIMLNTGVFVLLFRRALRVRYPVTDLKQTIPRRAFFQTVLAVLALVAAGYVIASAAGAPLSFVALGGGALLLLVAALYRGVTWQRLRHDISWSLFVFITGLFLVVRGVENLGLTREFGALLLRLSGGGELAATLLVAGGSALGANLVNNVPMALVMISALHAAPVDPAQLTTLKYATILGADLGPNLAPTGSLATILWLLILRRRGLEISTAQYMKLGLTVVPAMLLAGALLVWLHL